MYIILFQSLLPNIQSSQQITMIMLSHSEVNPCTILFQSLLPSFPSSQQITVTMLSHSEVNPSSFHNKDNAGSRNRGQYGNLHKFILIKAKPIRPNFKSFRVMHICVSKLTIIGSGNGLSSGLHKAIIWSNAGILLIWSLGTHLSEIYIEIHIFSFMQMHLNMSSGKLQPFCLGLSVLT